MRYTIIKLLKESSKREARHHRQEILNKLQVDF